MKKEKQGCRFVPYTFSETKTQMVPIDLNIGFQGFALIQGQIYNPKKHAAKTLTDKSDVLSQVPRVFHLLTSTESGEVNPFVVGKSGFPSKATNKISKKNTSFRLSTATCVKWLRLESSKFYGIQSDELALQSALLGALASQAFRSARRRWMVWWVKFMTPMCFGWRDPSSPNGAVQMGFLGPWWCV